MQLGFGVLCSGSFLETHARDYGGLHLRHTRAKASQRSLGASLQGLTEFAVAMASPNTDGRNTKTKQKVSLKFRGSTPRNSRKEKRETIK